MTASGSASSTKAEKPLANRSWIQLPAPLRVIFDQFPLITYNSNAFPWRGQTSKNQHTLYIWTLPGDETLSPNPGCLKWQAYLLTRNIKFRTISSNNHASPSGALPFVQPANRSESEPRSLPIKSSKIPRWIEEITKQTEQQIPSSLMIYEPLIESSIRNAWLYHLYLIPGNFENVAAPIYIHSQSRNAAVRLKSARDLQKAAEESILKTRSNIDAQELFGQADAAFASLSSKLGSARFFHGDSTPSEFDLSLFAYTYPLLKLESNTVIAGWQDIRLPEIVCKYENLVQHAFRIEELCLKDHSSES